MIPKQINKTARLFELNEQLNHLNKKEFLSYRELSQKELLREKIQWLTIERDTETDNQRANRAIFIASAIVGFCLGIALGLSASIGIMSLFK